MPYIPPDLKTLEINTRDLYPKLTSLLKRYTVSADELEGSEKENKASALETLIARTNRLLEDTESERKSQLAVFKKLIDDDLRPVLHSGSDDQRKHAEMILLGALLHRYFRLIDSYDPAKMKVTNPLFILSFFTSVVTPTPLKSVTNCRLFIGLRAILKLPEDTTNYQINDLKLLDGVTIVTALECFQEHMYLNDRYKQYPHFKADEESFKKQLQEIINAHKPRALPVIHLFRTINFLKSLERKLAYEHQQKSEALDDWLTVLKADYKDFSRLSAATIQQHINDNIKAPLLKTHFVRLLKSPHVINNLYDPDSAESTPVAITAEQLVSKMKECHINKTCYTMIGGYLLIIELIDQLVFALADKYEVDKTDSEGYDLPAHELIDILARHKKIAKDENEDKRYLHAVRLLKSCIDEVDDFSVLTREGKSRALMWLKQFIDTKPTLDIQCFGDAANFESEIALLQEKLTRRECKPASQPAISR